MVENSPLIHHNNNNEGEELLSATAPNSKRVSICMGCGQEIYDQFILRVSPDLEWHAACLKCADCNQYLDESCTCFVRDGKTYCKTDYIKLFGAKCAKCNQKFNKNDYVMRARHKIYHIRCFHCVACNSVLQPGDEFALREDRLYCKADHDTLEQGCSNTFPIDTAPNLDFIAQPPLTPLGNGHVLAPMASVSLQPLDRSDSCGPALPPSSTVKIEQSTTTTTTTSGETTRSGKEKKKDKPKTTRVRTVLNEKQLHTLRTCYGANPRPDALMKEQLVEMTGLSPRVIRVWFQNKRCKDKKRQILMKHMQQQQEKNQALNGVRMQGMGPLVAASPTRHEQMPMVQPLDIQQFHANPAVWTPISADTIDSQTPFQQLMHGFGDGAGTDSSMFLNAGSFRTDSELDSFSPQMAPSDLSSPSCSE